MLFSGYATITDFYSKAELEQAVLLTFFHLKVNKVVCFSRKDLEQWMNEVDKHPNMARLMTKIRSSRDFVKSGKDSHKLSGARRTALEKSFPQVGSIVEIIHDGKVLPKEEYNHINRKYIRHIADQANWAYESGAYDAAAVMMRRLLEILIIHAYRKHGIDNKIKNNGTDHYLELDKLIGLVVNESTVGLTTGVVSKLKTLKEIGNLAAHDIAYTCKKDEIDSVLLDYRKVIVHLLDASGFHSKAKT